MQSAEEKKDIKPKKEISRGFKVDPTPHIDVSKMDQFVSQLYEYGQADKGEFIMNLRNYFKKNGEFLINIRDSAGNYLIHHLCFIFEDSDADIFINLVRCLTGNMPESTTPPPKATKQNSLQQTCLHLLAQQKKVALLMILLKVLLEESDHQDQNSNINQKDGNGRTFLHIILNNNLINAYEDIVKKYSEHLDFEITDYHFNHMMYKNLKNKQLSHLKQSKQYDQLIEQILRVDLKVYGDIRNILFDREIGTNILTDLARYSSQEDFFELLKKIMPLVEEWKIELEPLINSTAQDGSNILMKVFSQFSVDNIEQFIEVVGIENFKKISNKLSKKNLMHYLFQNVYLSGYERTRIYRRLRLIDSRMVDQNDNFGNYPVNYLIDRVSRDQLNQDDKNLLIEVLDNTNLKGLQDYSNEYDRKLKKLRVKLFTRPKEDQQSSEERWRDKRKRREKFKQYIKDKISGLDVFPIQPLETAIRSGSFEVFKIVFEKKPVNPINQTSDQNTVLLEMCLNQENFNLFQYLIDHTPPSQFDRNHCTLHPLLRIYEKICKMSSEIKFQFLECYSSLVGKIIIKDRNSLQWMWDNLNLPIEESKEKVKPRNYLKWMTKDTLISEEVIQNFSSVYELLYFLARTHNWTIYNAIKDLPEFWDDDYDNTEEKLFHFLLLKDQCKRHDTQGVDCIIQLHPDCLHFKGTKKEAEFRNELSIAMFFKYRDIKDPNLIFHLKEKYQITLIPLLKDIKKKVKLPYQRDLKFKNLNKSQQKKLQNQLFSNAFQCSIEINYSKLEPQERELLREQIWKHENKSMYIQKLHEAKTLFEVFDIKDDANKVGFYNYIQQLCRQQQFDKVSSFLILMKQHLTKNYSFYPINYYAEVKQFQNNFPYRDFKIIEIIRKFNLKDDKFPLYLGQIEKNQIQDDEEDELNAIWENMMQPGSMESKKYVANAFCIIFKMFSKYGPIKITVNDKNYQQVIDLVDQVFEFGGFPFIEIEQPHSKLVNLIPKEKLEEIKRYNKVLQKFNLSLKRQNLKTIVHEVAIQPYDQYMEKLIQSFLKPDSLQKFNFNSHDQIGRTPLALALELKNMKFIELSLTNNPSQIINQSFQYSQILQKFYQEATIEQKCQLLALQSKKVKQMDKGQKDFQNQLDKGQIEDHINILYSDSFIELVTDEKFDSAEYQSVKLLKIKHQIREKCQKQMIQTFKFQRKILQDIQNREGSVYSVEYLLYQRQISPMSFLGDYMHEMGAKISLIQLQQLESLGYNFCNSICSKFEENSNLMKNKKYPINPFFPFKFKFYQHSYLLKYVLLFQPSNMELIVHIYEKIDKQAFGPFLFEIMIFVGRILGTKNEIFIELFENELAYTMERQLTGCESRLSKFKGVKCPNYVLSHYTKRAYKNMLCELLDILIFNNEEQMFDQFIQDQAKIFINKKMISQGLKSACRYMRSSIAIKLCAFGLKTGVDLKDYSDYMPSLELKTTLRDIQLTQIITESVRELTMKNFMVKINREIMDKFLTYIIDQKMLQLFFKLYKKNYTGKRSVNILFKKIYQKSSPEVFNKLIASLLDLYPEHPKIQYKLMKIISESHIQMPKSVSKVLPSKNHQSSRKRDIMKYLYNNMIVISQSQHYVQLINDQSKRHLLLGQLDLSNQDFEEFRVQINKLANNFEQINKTEFVYEDTIMFMKQVSQFQSKIIDPFAFDHKDILNLNLDNKDEKDISSNVYSLHKWFKSTIQIDKENKDKIQDLENQSINKKQLIIKKPQYSVPRVLFNTDNEFVCNNSFEELLMIQKLEFILDRFKPEQLSYQKIEKIKCIQTNLIMIPRAFEINLIARNKRIQAYKNNEMGRVPDEDQNENEVKASFLDDIFNQFHNQVDTIIGIFKATSNPHNQVVAIQLALKLVTPEILLKFTQLERNELRDLLNYDQMALAKLLQHEKLYQALKESLILPIIRNTDSKFDFLFEEGASELDRNRFTAMIVTVFYHDDLEAQKEIIDSDKWVKIMGRDAKIIIFAYLASKTDQFDQVNDLLVKLCPYMEGIEQVNYSYLQGAWQINLRRKLLMPISSSYYIVEGSKSSDLIQYLLKMNRYQTAKYYAENLNGETFGFSMFLHQLRNEDLEISQEYIGLFVDTDNCTLNSNLVKLSQVVIDSKSEAIIKRIDQLFDNKLLHLEITEQEANQDEKSCILSRMILSGYSDKVQVLLSFCNEEQKEKLIECCRPFEQGDMVYEQDHIHPFAVALYQGRVDLARQLFLPSEKYEKMTMADFDSIQAYLNKQIVQLKNTLNDQQKSHHDKVCILLDQNQDSLIKVGTDSLVPKMSQISQQDLFMKLILFPELISYILAGLQINYKEHWEPENTSWSEADHDRFYQVHVLYPIQKFAVLAKRGLGFNPLVDAFFLKIGLIQLSDVMKAHFKESYILYMLQNGNNLTDYFNSIKKDTYNKELLFKPYDYFKQRGLLKGNDNNYTDFEEQLRLIDADGAIMRIFTQYNEKLISQQETELNEFFGYSFREYFKRGFNHNWFCLNYFLLQVHKEVQINQDLSVIELGNLQWYLNFTTLAQDLIIVETLQQIFPSEKELFKRDISVKEKRSISSEFEIGNSVNMNVSARTLAFIIYLYNSYKREDLLKPQDDICNYSYQFDKNNIKAIDIFAWLLQSQCPAIKQQEEKYYIEEYDQIIHINQLILETLELYEKTFNNKDGEFKQLKQKLNFQQLMVQDQSIIHDSKMIDLLKSLNDFENKTLKTDFSVKLDADIFNFMKIDTNNQYFQKTIAYTKFITQDLRWAIEILKQYVGLKQSATLDIEISSSKKSSCQNIIDYTAHVVINIEDLNNVSKIEQLGAQLRTILITQTFHKFIKQSKEKLVKLFNCEDFQIDSENDPFKIVFNQEEALIVQDIIKGDFIKQLKGSIQFDLHAYLEDLLLAYPNLKQQNKLKAKTINLRFKPYDQWYQDYRYKADESVASALKFDENQTIDLNFSLDLKAKTLQFDEVSFQLLQLAYIETLKSRFVSIIKYKKTDTQFMRDRGHFIYKTPQYDVDILSLYQRIIVNSYKDEGFERPNIIAENILLHNAQIQLALQKLIGDLLTQFERNFDITKSRYKKYNTRTQVYQLIRNINLAFDVDSNIVNFQQCLEIVSDETVKKDIDIVISDFLIDVVQLETKDYVGISSKQKEALLKSIVEDESFNLPNDVGSIDVNIKLLMTFKDL
ncbi:UNKNOWN [Stylonychia lemnae]|uniref:Uncharacterized protein n=1 Tax=Stylonychia lemnae TaxID=5949 RepID=A0A078B4F6_STYLE|nr:UNKNOWN [Stylonychia lemnae]|eukprot:CDW88097.1 UNKNOWN [Stylonychia lemnae]